MLALASGGCSLFIGADTGYAHAFAQAPERSAATVNAQVGVGGGGENGGAGGGWALRTKWSDNVQQLSLGPMLYAVVGTTEKSGLPDFAAFFMGGFDLFTVESVAGRGEASIGSPFVQVGTFFHVHDKWGLTASVSFEDDLRFDATPNTGYVSFLLGWAILAYGTGGGAHFWH